MIVVSIQWDTDDQEQLKKLPSTMHAIDDVDFEYAKDWLYRKYKTNVKSFHVLQRGLSKQEDNNDQNY